jgi:transcriptional regulator with PAS, ATPase and Fis domain
VKDDLIYSPRMTVVASLTRERIRVTDAPEDPVTIMMQSFEMKPLKQATREFQKLYMQFAVRKYGDQKIAARQLGIHRNLVSRVLNDRPLSGRAPKKP